MDKKGFRSTGTMRKDLMMKFPLIDMKQMKRKERVLYDYRSDGKIEIVWWNDSSVVTIGHNSYSGESIGTVKRWVKGVGKSHLNQPAVIAVYSQGMGRVDSLNRALSEMSAVKGGIGLY